jgi:hypothetical protein
MESDLIIGTSNPKAAPENDKMSKAPLIPKFASEAAAIVCELRKSEL